MPAIAVICVDCGTTLFRHPNMRTRRVVCFECQKKKKAAARETRVELDCPFTAKPFKTQEEAG